MELKGYTPAIVLIVVGVVVGVGFFKALGGMVFRAETENPSISRRPLWKFRPSNQVH